MIGVRSGQPDGGNLAEHATDGSANQPLRIEFSRKLLRGIASFSEFGVDSFAVKMSRSVLSTEHDSDFPKAEFGSVPPTADRHVASMIKPESTAVPFSEKCNP